jgi:hypothetical protein
VDIKDFSKWTTRVHESVKLIPHDNIFMLLDDIFLSRNIHDELRVLFAFFQALEADALRILLKPSKATTVNDTNLVFQGRPIQRLSQKSKYLISYTPNIWKRDFLLKCTNRAMDIWKSEVKGTKALFREDHGVYSYVLPDWYIAVSRSGKLTEEGKDLMEKNK